MASLLDDDELVGVPRMADEDDDLEIQELVVDDLHVVDMLGGHADVVNEVTVLDSDPDRSETMMNESLQLPPAEEVVLDSPYVSEDPVSAVEPKVDLCTDYPASGVSHGSGRKAKVGGKPKKQGGKVGSRAGSAGGTTSGAGDSGTAVSRTARKWERKQVQIKTLEGEFTVTVWATGKQLRQWLWNRHHGFTCLVYVTTTQPCM